MARVRGERSKKKVGFGGPGYVLSEKIGENNDHSAA